MTIEQNLTVNDEAISLTERIAADLRAGVLVKAARRVGRIVVIDAKPRITRPGYKGDKAGLKPLRDSVSVAVRDYKFRVLAVVGSSWPAGAHGHLVESGHMQTKKDGTTFHVPPHPWLRPAVESTRDAQDAAALDELKRAAPKS